MPVLESAVITVLSVLVLLTVAGVGGSSTMVLAVRERLRRRRRMARLATALEQAGLSRTDAARWEGVLDDEALASMEAVGTVPGSFRLRIRTGDLTIGPRDLQGGRRTGDPTFDRRFRVDGSSGDRARLTAEARTRCVALRGVGRLTLIDGVLALRVTGVRAAELTEAVEELRDLANLLEARRTTPRGRLIRMVRRDPVPAVRIRALASLESLDGDAAKHEAGRGLHDADAEFRLACARHRGWEAPLVRAVDDVDLPDRLRAQAARWLIGLASLDDLEGLARRLACSGTAELEEAAVALALHAGDELALVRLLNAHSPTALRAALVALREVGTSEALPMLRTLEHRSAAWTSRRRLATDAIEAIRTRGADVAGALTLAELGELVGAVSPVPTDGSVSLA